MSGPVNVEVEGLAYRSQDVGPASVFVAIPGSKTDGHKFIPQALEAGAKALIVKQAPRDLPEGIAVAEVDDPRRAMAKASSRFYGHPSRRIPVCGITGTNGKTTTTYLLESIWKAAGKNPAVIGTVNYRLGNDVRSAPVTTPESLDIQRMLDEMIGRGADSAAIEVSSHALEQGRVWGLKFAARAFSNLSQDHLDYHGDMESYWAAKSKLFTDPEFEDSGKAAINADDPYGARLIGLIAGKALPFGIDTKLENALRPLEWKIDLEGIRAKITSPAAAYNINSPLLGRANLYNILCAMALAQTVGVESKDVEAGVEALKRVPGRLDRVENGSGRLVVVDYSHTPDALEKAIVTLREVTPGKLIAVFGCGGDRDRGKRPIMGRIGTELADAAIITSDNPRTEEPMAIIGEILTGAVGARKPSPLQKINGNEKVYWVEPDRKKAIFQAIGAAGRGDTVLIAGKGHEDYQILGEKKIHFDDREVASEALGK